MYYRYINLSWVVWPILLPTRVYTMLKSLQNLLRREVSFKIGLITTSLSLRKVQQRGPLKRYAAFCIKFFVMRKVCRYGDIAVGAHQHLLHNYNVFVTQKGFLGLWGERVDSIDFYKQQIKDIDDKVSVPTTFRQCSHSIGFSCIYFLPFHYFAGY